MELPDRLGSGASTTADRVPADVSRPELEFRDGHLQARRGFSEGARDGAASAAAPLT